MFPQTLDLSLKAACTFTFLLNVVGDNDTQVIGVGVCSLPLHISFEEARVHFVFTRANLVTSANHGAIVGLLHLLQLDVNRKLALGGRLARRHRGIACEVGRISYHANRFQERLK
jgi:hypothetical protein